MQDAKERLIFALDVNSFEEAHSWVERLRGLVGMFKIGKQLFTKCGPEIVHMVRGSGTEVFLDLKYHDIPNTVAMAGTEAVRLGVKMFNVHALGGFDMMSRLVDQVNTVCQKNGLPKPLLLAVTILTSATDDSLRQIGIKLPVSEMVYRLASLAKEAGLDGVVASPREVGLIRQACGSDFTVVTPGVRPLFASQDDQQRITTPGDAIRSGADYLVIGRPISAAKDPIEASELIVAEMQAAIDDNR